MPTEQKTQNHKFKDLARELECDESEGAFDEALELFAREVMPEFHAGEEERQAKKMKELEPFIEAAFKRKEYMAAPSDEDIPNVVALGRRITEPSAAEKAAAEKAEGKTMAEMAGVKPAGE